MHAFFQLSNIIICHLFNALLIDNTLLFLLNLILLSQILAESVQGAAESALRMLCDATYGNAETDITDFFLALFTCLLQQLGQFTYTAINVFLEVANR